MFRRLLNLQVFLQAVILLLSMASCKKTLSTSEPGNLVPVTVMEDAGIPAINVNGTRLHAETFGDPTNPMLVILHGGPGVDYRSMLNCKAFAADGYYVVFFDQRGCGLSQRHEKESYSISLLLDDVCGVIAHYRTSAQQKVFLIGQSWGAMLATAYVNQYPGTVQGLILSEPGGFTWQQTKDYLNRIRQLNPFSEAGNDPLYVGQFLSGNQQDHQVKDYNLAITSAIDTRPGNITGNAGPYPFWRMGAIMNAACIEIAERDGFNWTTQLNQFSTTVLFCYSEKNKAYGHDYAQQLAAAYPHVQLEQITGSGHELFYFGWNSFYPVAKTYLNNLK